MTDEGDDEDLPSTMSARDDPEDIRSTKELANENDMSLSDVLRSSAELYRTDPTFRQGLNSFYEGEVGSLTEFYATEEDALEGLVSYVQRETGHFDPEEVDSALADLMEGLSEREEEEVYDAAESFGKLDPGLGVTVARYAGKFADDYWGQASE